MKELLSSTTENIIYAKLIPKEQQQPKPKEGINWILMFIIVILGIGGILIFRYSKQTSKCPSLRRFDYTRQKIANNIIKRTIGSVHKPLSFLFVGKEMDEMNRTAKNLYQALSCFDNSWSFSYLNSKNIEMEIVQQLKRSPKTVFVLNIQNIPYEDLSFFEAALDANYAVVRYKNDQV